MRQEDQRRWVTLIADISKAMGRISPEGITALNKWMDESWFEEALLAEGTTTLRKRRLPAWQVVWLLIGIAMMSARSVANVAATLGVAVPKRGKALVAKSALVQARQRLGADVVSYLFMRAAEVWGQATAYRWRGLNVYAVDGTTLRVEDTDENHEHFGRHHSGTRRTPSSHPMLRMVVMANVRSRLFVGAELGPCTTSELALAKPLLASIPAQSVVILDRLYTGSPQLLLVTAAQDRNFIVRAKKNQRWVVTKRLGDNDAQVEIEVSDEARHKDPSLPRTWSCRAITYRTPRGQHHTLLTSLTDWAAYPAAEVVALYSERWEIELAYDELKTVVLKQRIALRSRTVVGVYQEAWGMLLAYNLVRREMFEIAAEAGVPPFRISFTAAFHYILDEWRWAANTSPGAIPKALRALREDIAGFILPPRRSERSYDRVVKRKESPYPRKSTASRKKVAN